MTSAASPAVRIIVTGGTFDKHYDAIKGELTFKQTHLPAILEQARVTVPVQIEINQLIDSLNMEDSHRERVLASCRAAGEDCIIVIHGTDTMALTAQVVGQALSLPATMTFYSFIGIAVTSATAIIFGQAIWDPVQVLARLGNPIAVVVAMLALLLATLNVNVAANLVSPSNDFSNLSPRLISFRTGGLISCVVGVVVFQPWKLLANYSNYIFNWLVGYSGFLGPIAGVMICDYFVVRKTIILVEDLYQRHGFYEFSRGINWRAMAALAAGAGVAFIGLVVPPLRVLYDYAWFVGFATSFIVYWAVMKTLRNQEAR